MIANLRLNDPRKTLQIRRWLAAILIAVAVGSPLGAWLARKSTSPITFVTSQKKWEEIGGIEDRGYGDGSQLKFAGKSSQMRFIKSTIPLKPAAPGYILHIPEDVLTRVNDATFWSFSLYTNDGKMLFVDKNWPVLQMTPKYLVKNSEGGITIHITNSLKHPSYYTLPLPDEEFVIVWRLYGSTNIIVDLLQPQIGVLDDKKTTSKGRPS